MKKNRQKFSGSEKNVNLASRECKSNSISVYARFRTFGPRKQHKYHLCAGSQHLIWALVESSRGCHYTGLGAAILFCSSTDHMDIGLPFCFTALLRIYSSTDGLRDM